MTRELILVPVDYAGCATAVCDMAANLASRLDAEVVLLYVTQLPPGVPEGAHLGDLNHTGAVEKLDDDAAAHMKSLQRIFDAEGVPTRLRVSHGRPAQQILSVTDEVGASMIVMGTHGRKGLMRAVLGSVCEEVIRNTDVPVTIVRSGNVAMHPGRTAAQIEVEAEAYG